MTDKRHLETDPTTGTVTNFEYDDSNDQVTIHQQTDLTEQIEANKRRQNDGTGGWLSPSKELRHAAHIPLAVCELWRQMYGVNVMDPNHREAVKRLLNDSEWQFLRTGRFTL